MPELPEVEATRRSLAPGLIGRRIVRVSLRRADVARRGDGQACRPRDLLRDAVVLALVRHGKRLAILARDGRALGVRLGMTGQLRVVPPGTDLPPHTHVVWCLDDGRRLIFRDARRFGGLVGLRSAAELARWWSRLGPDAATITADLLATRASSSRRAIKAVLLDQHVLAGVGNIYADEALFEAGLSPRRRACDLTGRQYCRLTEALRTVLARALAAGGTTLRDYLDGTGHPGHAQHTLRVYGRAGQPCPRCRCPLRAAALAQRTTTFCPRCQR